MSNTYPTPAAGTTAVDPLGTSNLDSAASSDGTPGAKERASEVKDTSVAAGQHVTGVAKDEIHRVGSESKRQAKDLYRQTQSELADQAASQQKRVASGIRSLGDELGSMADTSETQGVAADLAHQAASRAAGVADWLDQRDPGALLDEVKSFARRKPGMFITIAAVAGVVAGRLTRSVIAEAKDSSETGPGSPATTAPIGTSSTSSATGAATPTGFDTQTGAIGADPDLGTATGVDTAFETPFDDDPTPDPSGVGTPLAAGYPEHRESRNE